MIDEKQILRIAKSKLDIIFYRDFRELEPLHTQGSHWLFKIKETLKHNGYKCHEARAKWKWDCDYTGDYTHFHKE